MACGIGIRDGRPRHSGGVWIALASLASVIVFALWFTGHLFDPFSGQRFDRTVWVAAKADDPDSPRGPMARDVMRHHLRPGMTRNEVIRVLGPPDSIPSSRSLQGGDRIEYLVGSGGTWDYCALTIQFDLAGKLVSAGIYQH